MYVLIIIFMISTLVGCSKQSFPELVHEKVAKVNPIPKGRQRRYVNAQEYMSADDVPKYLVRINRVAVGANKAHTMCTGSIIAANLVLTSGGCLHEDWVSFDKEKRLIPISQIEVVAGRYNSSATNSEEERKWSPIQMYIHPELKMVDHRKMWQNDIAIIQVDDESAFGDEDKIELWLSHFAANDSDYYTTLRASGYGDWGSHNSKQYDNLFDSSYPFPRDVPQYQYLAYMEGGKCDTKFSKVNDVEDKMVTHRPNAVNQYSAKPLMTAKRCFYTSSVGLVGYIPTKGDHGGPITWTSNDNNITYQVMLVPWEPESKASFETDMNYVHWGELLSYYTDFIGKVFDAAAATGKADHKPEFSPSSASPFTQTVSLKYFGHFQFYTNFTVEPKKYVQVNITMSGENAAYTMRNTVVNVRDINTKRVLRQYLGLNRTVTESVVVMAGSDGTVGDKWGCSLKEGEEYTDPPAADPDADPTVLSTDTTDGTESVPEELSEDTYTCIDAPVNSEGGELNTPSSFVLNSNWETVFFNSTAGKSFEIEFWINRPSHSADKGTVTLKVDYVYLDKNKYVEEVEDPCDSGHVMCEDQLSCINPDHVCDNDPDCYDKNDESSWCLDRPCLYSQYQCTTGECVDLRKLCDGRCDCLDKTVCEDETLLCSDSPFQQDFLLVLEQAAIEKAVEKKENGEIQRKSQVSSSAENFEIALSFVLFITYGLCYILD